MESIPTSRMMIYLESYDSEWIILRIVTFHYTIFKTDILDLLNILEIEIPLWFQEILSKAQKSEFRPIPTAPTPVGLPSLNAFINFIPYTISTDNAYPIWGGFQFGGFVLNPGGEPQYQVVPYTARLCSFSFLGLNAWTQGGMLNGALVLVSQALLYYRKAPLARALHPSLSLAGLTRAYGLPGGALWYDPALQSQSACLDDDLKARDTTMYQGGGYYSIERIWYMDGENPPEVPLGHILNPDAEKKGTVWVDESNAYFCRVALVDRYAYPDSLDTVPGCCNGINPSPDWVAESGYRYIQLPFPNCWEIRKAIGGQCKGGQGIAGGGLPSPMTGIVIIEEVPEALKGKALISIPAILLAGAVIGQYLPGKENLMNLRPATGAEKQKILVGGNPVEVGGGLLQPGKEE